MNRGAMNVTNVTIGVAFLAALGTWLFLRPAETESQVAPVAGTSAASRTEQSDVSEKALASLKAEVATLKREHDQLVQSLNAVEAALTRSISLSVQTGPPSNAAEEAEAGNTKGLSEEQRIANTLYELDLRLGKEFDDPAWSQKTEVEITTLLHTEAIEGSRVLSTDCHSTLCRVEVEHQDADAQSWLVDHLPMEPPFDGEMLVRQIDDDPLARRTLIYVARREHPLLAATP